MMTINRATSRFPAILIGGPPHAGKSVLAYSLKQSLLQQHLSFYLLRAAPDGEGDWFHDSAPEVGQRLRQKGQFTPHWVTQICQDIAYRPLPFLVDVGGRPEPWQESIFQQCSHAILVITDEASLAEWQAIIQRNNVIPLAILRSEQHGVSCLTAETPLIEGVITQLERGQTAHGPLFEALSKRVASLFHYEPADLWNIHQSQAPVELVVDIRRMFKQLFPQRDYGWAGEDLPTILEYLPTDTPLALYGIAPAWLYATVACAIQPESFYQFDARRGWITPPHLTPAEPIASLWQCKCLETATSHHLSFTLAHDYLPYEENLAAPLPSTGDKGVILAGKLPIWLYSALALYYHTAPWVAIYYPQCHGAIVVYTQQPESYPIGLTIL